MNALVKANPLRPATFAEMERFCAMAARSGMVPKDYIGKPEAIMIAVQLGSELGLAPMQSLQNVSVINGRPSVWGDAMPALVRASGLCEWMKETVDGDGESAVATCSAKRLGDPEPITRTFSAGDAKKAGLWGKTGPWQQYPNRMLAMRARSWCLRDGFADVLKGLMAVEEARDIPDDKVPYQGTTIEAKAEPVAVPPPPVAEPPAKVSISGWLDAFALELAGAQTSADLDAILAQESVKRAHAAFTGLAKGRLDDMVHAAIVRTSGRIDGVDDGVPEDEHDDGVVPRDGSDSV